MPKLDALIFWSLRHLALESRSLFISLKYPKILSLFMTTLMEFRQLERITILTPESDPDDDEIFFFELFRKPMHEWPTSTVDNQSEIFTREAQLYMPETVQRPLWIKQGIEKILTAVGDCSRLEPKWKLPQVELKGIARGVRHNEETRGTF